MSWATAWTTAPTAPEWLGLGQAPEGARWLQLSSDALAGTGGNWAGGMLGPGNGSTAEASAFEVASSSCDNALDQADRDALPTASTAALT